MVFLFGTVLLRAESAAPPKFETDVRAILKTHCFQCHGEEPEVQGNLDLRLVRFMHRGGDSGTAVVPGKPEESILYQRLRDGEMPPDESKQISRDELQVIRGWILAGAKTLRPEPESLGAEAHITEEERTHWSLQPIQRPTIPMSSIATLWPTPLMHSCSKNCESMIWNSAPRHHLKTVPSSFA